MTQQKHQFRLTLEFSIHIDDSAIQSGETTRERTYNARQRRLLQAILSDEAKLQAYLQYQIAGYLEGMSAGDWHGIACEYETDEIHDVVKPAIAMLSKADQQFFAGAEQHGVLYENIEKMDDCFYAELETASLVEVDEQGSEVGQ